MNWDPLISENCSRGEEHHRADRPEVDRGQKEENCNDRHKRRPLHEEETSKPSPGSHRSSRIRPNARKISVLIRANPWQKRLGLRQVEEQYFGVFLWPLNAQLLFVADGCAIALCQRLSVQFDCAARDLEPAVTSRGELVRDFFAGLEQRDIQLSILIIFTDPSLASRDAISRNFPCFLLFGKDFCS